MVRVIRLVLLICALAAVSATGVSAQRTGANIGELHGFGGYRWTWSQGVYDYYTDTAGDIDIKSSWFWAVALDVNTPIRPGLQLELLYDRQSSELTFKNRSGKDTVADITVEYMHIGGVQAIHQAGPLVPFTSFTLGATRYSFDNPRVGADVPGAWDDIWKMSGIIGLGAKFYGSERVGFRLIGRLPITFTSGGMSFGYGSSGSGLSVSANGITQIDVNGGVFVTF